ncbi:MAG: hypothetical protein HYU80_04240 [Candidatus Blackburnbacteria bacterium]|nr:hypothetical protein [Candidatus Blackburnbacteria bacterium]
MGITELELEVINPANTKKKEKVKFLVDSGAVYSVAPEVVLKRLGVRPHSKEKFILADGSEIIRERSDAL